MCFLVSSQHSLFTCSQLSPYSPCLSVDGAVFVLLAFWTECSAASFSDCLEEKRSYGGGRGCLSEAIKQLAGHHVKAHKTGAMHCR